MATDFTDGLALQALKLAFKYLPECYESAVSGVLIHMLEKEWLMLQL